jgi:tetraprenyl-beta-curcumene synthase
MTTRAPGQAGALRDSDGDTMRAAALFALANLRYLTQIAPLVRVGIEHWEARARRIPDSELRELALWKLAEERANVAGAAMFASLAPRAHRGAAARASIPVEVIYNYLDALTERPGPEPLREGRELFRALSDPFSLGQPRDAAYYATSAGRDDGGYLDELVAGARAALERLPAIAAVRGVARRTAVRCGEAQVRMHAAPFIGDEQLRRWAIREREVHGMSWQELLAGAAASGVTLHALIAAAADPGTTQEHAQAVDSLYLPVSAVSMMLDSLVDRERDIERTGRPGFIRLWPDEATLPRRIGDLVSRAVDQAQPLHDGSKHLARIYAIVAYYTSDQGARSRRARPLVAQVHRELGPLIWLTLPSLRGWRLARALGGGRRVRALPVPA